MTARREEILKSAVCDGLLGRSWLPLFGVYVTTMRRHMAYENDVIFSEILAALDAPGGARVADAPALMDRVA